MSSIESSHEFQLPVLDFLQEKLLSTVSGGVVCSAPVANNHLQVGFKGAPESIGSIAADIRGDNLMINVGNFSIEGPVLDMDTRKVMRHVTPEIGELLLKKVRSGVWVVGKESPVELDSRDRLVVSRTMAKFAERAVSKL